MITIKIKIKKITARFLTRIGTGASLSKTGGQFYAASSRKTALIRQRFFLPGRQGILGGGISGLSCHGNFSFGRQHFDPSPKLFKPEPKRRGLEPGKSVRPPRHRGGWQTLFVLRPKPRGRLPGIVSCAGIILICRPVILSRQSSLASWQKALVFLRRAGRRPAPLKAISGKLFLTT
jgi:hypothetical protein